ncbi:MAG: propionate CoA-transferase, partial [Oscillospiraceae bacterium]|nr:propionate CoA-transferase [Oscillospiraceae bacterium]
CIGLNAFLALNNTETLHRALAERFARTGHPGALRLFCAAGFGMWDETRQAEPYIKLGAVQEIVAGHYGSMPIASRYAMENRIEAYNMPLGVLSQAIRAAAAGQPGLLSKVGLNLFVDPRVGGAALNERSKKQWVDYVEVAGEPYLYYKTPRIDVAFIRGSTVDPNGNITFEREYLSLDALAMAQATKANGGTVIVEVSQVSHLFSRPQSVIVPGMLVDYVVVREEESMLGPYNPALSGDIHVPTSHMDYYMGQLRTSRRSRNPLDVSMDLIGARAAREMAAGDIVNIGVGIPETVGHHASRLGILKDTVMTVESGGIGGLPAPGVAFGATIGADMVCPMAAQFDFYDGGGLDVCFMGGLEVDRFGNVNAHHLSPGFVGIGGFANITHATKKVVFCMTFNTKGLHVQRQGEEVQIVREGDVPKFRQEIAAISFSAKNALERGQQVLYVTERCVFRLTAEGLKLEEVYPGVDAQRDVLDRLDFTVK